MKTFISLLVLLLFTNIIFGNTIIVDINGSGQHNSIQAGINSSVTGDTIKVYPGTYYEQINLNKNIVLMGSGYESTKITGTYTTTVTITAGKMMWFTISSLSGIGVFISSGILTNCVVIACPTVGIFNNISGATGNVYNCVIWNCGNQGINVDEGYLNVVNCISRNNGSWGFEGYSGNRINLSYSNGSRSYTNGNQGCIDVDPAFTSPPDDFHISQSSSSWDTGNPSLLDPDGSRSDMGYFGGPDCPIYPTVFSIIITPTGNNVDLQAKGRANY